MKRTALIPTTLLVLVVTITGCTAWRGSLDSPAAQPSLNEVRSRYAKPLDDYLAGLRDLADSLRAGATEGRAERAASDVATAFLRATETTRASLDTSPRPIAILEELKNFRSRTRAAAIQGLSADAVERATLSARFKELFQDKDDAHWKAVGNVLLKEAQPWLDRRADLFSRKYFHDPEDPGGNILEAWLNSHSICRSAQIGEPRYPETSGVSPWETVARIEPLVSVEDSTEIGVVGALGLTYHLFPETDKRDFWSDWVQRTGLRIGAGYAEQSGETGDFVFGGGVQLRSLTVWGMYNPEERDFFIAVGASDFRWLSEITTWFE